MTRKPKQNFAPPSPEVDAAFDNISRTARLCAATLFGEPPVDDPNDASPRAQVMMMGMLYFLYRIDPRDIDALYHGEGGFAGWNHRPFPPDHHQKRGPFGQFWN